MNLTRTLKTGALALSFGLIGLTAQAEAQPPMMHGGPGMHGEMMAMHGLKAAGASDSQMQQIKAIFKQAMTDSKPAHDQLRSLHQQMEALFAAPVVDANSVTALQNQAQTQHAAIATRMTRAMIDSANVLTPEQRAKLQAMHAKRAEHMKERMKELATDRHAPAQQ